MEWSVIIAQIFVVLINVYIANTENKKKLYGVVWLFNFINMCMYFLNNDITTTVIYIVITIRSFIYIYKDNFKTNIIPIVAILAQLVVGFRFIDNAWQLIPIFVPCLVCYYMWFGKNTQELRIYNAVCNALWAAYNIKTHLYIIAISRIITVITNLEAYYRKRKIKRDETNVMLNKIMQ